VNLLSLSLSLALALADPAAPPAAAATNAATSAGPRQLVNRTVAVVNGDVVTLQELQDRAGEEWKRVARMPAGAEREQVARSTLRKAYEVVLAEKLFHAQAQALQVEISDQQIDQAVAGKQAEMKVNERQFDEVLAEAGLNRAAYRVMVRRDLENYRVLEAKVRSRVKVQDDDVKNYYQLHQHDYAGEEELHVRHIFLPLPEDASPAAEQAARAEGEKVVQRIASGEEFAKVARQVSKGPGAEDGGDLGWLRRGTIQKALEDVAFALQDGQVSRLVRSGPGLHLFKVDERRHGGGKTLDQAKDEIRDRLSYEQLQTYRDQYLSELKRDAVVEVTLADLQDEPAARP
jgi:peptidyl-prolyl cis-trans isomerase SurA